jgi:hypothetical protein
LFRDNVREFRVWAFITKACVFVRVKRVVRLTPKGRQNAYRVLDRVRHTPSLSQTSLRHCLVLELWITQALTLKVSRTRHSQISTRSKRHDQRRQGETQAVLEQCVYPSKRIRLAQVNVETNKGLSESVFGGVER